MSSLALWLGVGLLGGLGACARVLVGELVQSRADVRLPLGTIVVNVSGSLLLGVASGIALSGDARLLAGTAAIGSYTTFSTWMLEAELLAHERRRTLLVVNIVLSVALGLAAAALGRAIAGG